MWDSSAVGGWQRGGRVAARWAGAGGYAVSSGTSGAASAGFSQGAGNGK